MSRKHLGTQRDRKNSFDRTEIETSFSIDKLWRICATAGGAEIARQMNDASVEEVFNNIYCLRRIFIFVPESSFRSVAVVCRHWRSNCLFVNPTNRLLVGVRGLQRRGRKYVERVRQQCNALFDYANEYLDFDDDVLRAVVVLGNVGGVIQLLELRGAYCRNIISECIGVAVAGPCASLRVVKLLFDVAAPDEHQLIELIKTSGDNAEICAFLVARLPPSRRWRLCECFWDVCRKFNVISARVLLDAEPMCASWLTSAQYNLLIGNGRYDMVDFALTNTPVHPAGHNNGSLHHACLRGQHAIFGRLLRDPRVDVNLCHTEILMTAVVAGEAGIVAMLIDRDRTLPRRINTQLTAQSNNAVFYAALFGEVAIARMLLDAPAVRGQLQDALRRRSIGVRFSAVHYEKCRSNFPYRRTKTLLATRHYDNAEMHRYEPFPFQEYAFAGGSRTQYYIGLPTQAECDAQRAALAVLGEQSHRVRDDDDDDDDDDDNYSDNTRRERAHNKSIANEANAMTFYEESEGRITPAKFNPNAISWHSLLVRPEPSAYVLPDVLCAAVIGRSLPLVEHLLAPQYRTIVDPSARHSLCLRYALEFNRRGDVPDNDDIPIALVRDGRANPAANAHEHVLQAVKQGRVRLVEAMLAHRRVRPAGADDKLLTAAVATMNRELVSLLLDSPTVGTTVGLVVAVRSAIKIEGSVDGAYCRLGITKELLARRGVQLTQDECCTLMETALTTVSPSEIIRELLKRTKSALSDKAWRLVALSAPHKSEEVPLMFLEAVGDDALPLYVVQRLLFAACRYARSTTVRRLLAHHANVLEPADWMGALRLCLQHTALVDLLLADRRFQCNAPVDTPAALLEMSLRVGNGETIIRLLNDRRFFHQGSALPLDMLPVGSAGMFDLAIDPGLQPFIELNQFAANLFLANRSVFLRLLDVPPYDEAFRRPGLLESAARTGDEIVLRALLADARALPKDDDNFLLRLLPEARTGCRLLLLEADARAKTARHNAREQMRGERAPFVDVLARRDRAARAQRKRLHESDEEVDDIEETTSDDDDSILEWIVPKSPKRKRSKK